MKNISEYSELKLRRPVRFFLTDIDDTLTTDGQLTAQAYSALFQLSQAGISVIPITGRPAGWCEMIARFWPVVGVVGENGGFYFNYVEKKMNRWFSLSEEQQDQAKKKLKIIELDVLKSVAGARVSSDQFCRMTDLAIDFNEDVNKLPDADVQKIIKIFEGHGASAKVSSIHVNGWFGTHTKLSTSLQLLQDVFSITPAEAKEVCVYAGDSPNDEPMFNYFPLSFGVANVNDFKAQMKSLPQFISNFKSGEGFCEIVNCVVNTLRR